MLLKHPSGPSNHRIHPLTLQDMVHSTSYGNTADALCPSCMTCVLHKDNSQAATRYSKVSSRGCLQVSA